MKKNYFVGKTIMLVLFIFALSGCSTTETNVQNETSTMETKKTESTETQTAEVVEPEPVKEISYKIVTEEDISYAGCKRVGIRIVVPDDSQKIEVESLMQKIIDDSKSQWDDITVWAYKNSEESLVSTIGYTMGMKEYSTCN